MVTPPAWPTIGLLINSHLCKSGLHDGIHCRASRLPTLAADFDRSPAYAGLADRLRLLIAGGRVDVDLRLPSERDLCLALEVSRTTVTRAYAALVEAGYAVARQGSGTYTRLPGGRRQAFDRSLTPHSGSEHLIDLSCAASAAAPGVAEAYAEAADELPHYLGGTGYFPTGLPALQQAIAATYDARGLPTDPDQVLVVPGALSALMVVAQGLLRPRDRALVESPGYPNGHAALRRAGARWVTAPMDVGGWDLDAIARVVKGARPQLAYLVPDFQNPTGNLMSNAQREQYAALLRRAGTIPLVDESHQALRLDGRPMPRPFAAFAPETVTLGSVSKSHVGRPAHGVDPVPCRALRAARGRPDRYGPRLPGVRAVGRGATAGRPRGASGPAVAEPCASSATPWPTPSPSGCRNGGSACRRAGCRCGSSCLLTTGPGRSTWSRRPRPEMSRCRPDRRSASTAASTRSCASPTPDPRTSFAPLWTGSPTPGTPWPAAPLAPLGVPASWWPETRGPLAPRDADLRPGRRRGARSASIACSISASASGGIAESTERATSAWPPSVSRETCMPAMLTRRRRGSGRPCRPCRAGRRR